MYLMSFPVKRASDEMAPVLYYFDLSPYCRSVLMMARAVGVTLELRVINLKQGDQLKPEFLAINPQHTVPTLVDGDLVLWERYYDLTKYWAICKTFLPCQVHSEAVNDFAIREV